MRRLLRFWPAGTRTTVLAWALPAVLSACSGAIDGNPGGTQQAGSSSVNGTGGQSSGTGSTPSTAGTGSGAGPAGGNGANPSSGGNSTSAGTTGTAGSPAAGGAGTAGAPAGTAGTAAGGSTAAPLCPQPAAINPGRAPLRRLTPFEYNNTIRDLFGDTSNPADAFPSDAVGNGFGNDAAQLSVSSLLAEQFEKAAGAIATRATSSATALGKLASCASNVAAANEESCARTVIESFTPLAYRRALVTGEADELLTLYKSVRSNSTFATGIAAVIQALLQAPDFLYRVEWGTPDPANAQLLRLTGEEMATRLSYFLWATTPDAALRAAAKAGELGTKQGVATHAERMIAAPQARPVIRYFFDSLLPLSITLERDPVRYPTYNPTIRSLMREETHRFLEYEIFEANGTWGSALTAPYTFLNQSLATYYGVTGVQGDTFQKVALDPSKRLGLLLQGSVLAGTTTTNHTNPVLRGGFIVHKIMCRTIPPPGDLGVPIVPPEVESGATARIRYNQHSANPVCAGCHQYMDPLGLALENYDAIGLYRTTENGVTIDASGSVPGTTGTVNNGVELVQKLAGAQEVQNCFASHWAEFAYGLTFGANDVCAKEAVQTAFTNSGFNIKKLLVALTQTDAFHYMPAR